MVFNCVGSKLYPFLVLQIRLAGTDCASLYNNNSDVWLYSSNQVLASCPLINGITPLNKYNNLREVKNSYHVSCCSYLVYLQGIS